MKRYIFNILIGITLLFVPSCSDILDEEPHSVITPELFKTPDGLQYGIIAAYNGLRYISGTESTMGATMLGTDEYTSAASGGTKELDMTPGNGGTGINSATGNINVFWNYPFSYINTCNGIIEFGPEAGLSEEMMAEAYFLRAYYYFQIVQMFGGAPLDLGAGELKFNTNPSTLSKRNTEDEVYEAIIDDMIYAVEHLPIAPRLPGCAFRASAIHYLAKIYLTNDEPGLALAESEKLLNISDPYTKNEYGVALLPVYSDVIRPTNERNNEVLFTCEHTETYSYNETAAGFGSGAVNKDDRSCSYFVPNYQTFKLRDADAAGILARTKEYSRPWIRFAPTYGLLNNIFADKTNDSRFNASFQTVWLNNKADAANGLLNLPIVTGDTAFVMLPYEVSDTYRATKNYRIWTPSQIDRSIFPALRKFFDPNRQDINDASGRPFLLAKLSETYLIAAEAALNSGDHAKARDYILVLRKRAATAGNEQAMIDATPATIDIDYILDERSRELCGEQMRWFDLKRTGKWRDRATIYSLNGIDMITRDILPHYDLRPIPQTQIDLMGNTEQEKKDYQNPDYITN